VAVLGYEECYVPSGSEMKLSDTGPSRAARPQPPSLLIHPTLLSRGKPCAALSRLAWAQYKAVAICLRKFNAPAGVSPARPSSTAV
jgi:hypothetical protein